MQAVRVAALDKPNNPFERYVLGSQQQMHMFGHHHEIMEQIMSLLPVVLKRFKEELAVCGNLKQPFAIGSHGGDKECSGMHGPRRG